MNDVKMCADFITAVLRGLQSECKKQEYCSDKKCKLYNREYATCLLRVCPCDYDLQEIEKRLIEIIQDKINESKRS